MNPAALAIQPKNAEELTIVAKELALCSWLPDHLFEKKNPNDKWSKPDRDKPRVSDILAILRQGAELGFGVMQSVDSIYVVDGRPALYVKGMLSLVRGSGVCRSLRVDELTRDRCTVSTLREGEESRQTVSVEIEDFAHLRNRGKDPSKNNWNLFPKDMLQARAMSRLCRLVYPDVIAGMTSAEELSDANPPEERVVEVASVETQWKTEKEHQDDLAEALAKSGEERTEAIRAINREIHQNKEKGSLSPAEAARLYHQGGSALQDSFLSEIDEAETTEALDAIRDRLSGMRLPVVRDRLNARRDDLTTFPAEDATEADQ